MRLFYYSLLYELETEHYRLVNAATAWVISIHPLAHPVVYKDVFKPTKINNLSSVLSLAWGLFSVEHLTYEVPGRHLSQMKVVCLYFEALSSSSTCL